MDKKKTIMIGIGETEDPLPEFPKSTKFWVFAGNCPECGSCGRELLLANHKIILKCDECGSELDTDLPAEEMHEIAYVYWCNRSRFATDLVKLEKKDMALLAQIEKSFADEYEIPRWAVVIIGGICVKARKCVNLNCVYNKKFQ
jgi:ribosomal protein S27AE